VHRSFPESTWLPALIRVLLLVPVAAGFVVLSLWLLGRPERAAFGQGMVPMAPSAALLFCVFGFAFFWSAHLHQNRNIQRAVAWIVVLGAVAAVTMGTLSALGIRPEVEHLGLARGHKELGGIPLGHISPLTAVAFLLAALAHLSTPTVFSRRVRNGILGFGFAALLLALSFLLLLTYLFSVPLLVGTSYIPPALMTSAAFLFLGFGLALRTLPHLPFLQDRTRGEVAVGLTYIGVFAFVAAGTLTLSFLHIRNYETELRTGAQKQLIAITDLKVHQLVAYRKERLADAGFLMNTPGLPGIASQVLQNPGDSRSRSQLQHWMDQLLTQGQYSLIRLMDDQGRVRLSSPGDPRPMGAATREAMAHVMDSGQPCLQDLHLSAQDQQPHLALLLPILDPHEPHPPRGVLALQIDPKTFLYPFLKAWPLPTRTAESLLVRREGGEVVFLNDLRFLENAPLRLRFPLAESDLPAARAALGQEGLVDGKDYRGIQAFAFLRQIPESPWALVARIDRAEVLAPMRARAWQLLGLDLLILSTVAFGFGFLWRTQRLRTLQTTLRAEVELRESDYRFRHAVEEVPFPMMIHAEDGEVIILSRAWTELSGYRLTDIPTIEAWTTKAYGIHRQRVADEISTLYSLEHRKAEGEYTITCSDGSTRIWDFSSVSLGQLPDGRRIAMSMASDVTERKQAEEQLRASEFLLKESQRAAQIGSYRMDFIKGLWTSSTVLDHILGIEPTYDRSVAGWADLIYPGDREAMELYLREEVLGKGKPFDKEYRISRKSDGAVRWVHGLGEVRFNGEGTPLSLTGTIMDVTERRETEEEKARLQVQLQQSQKMESLGTLAGGVAHDMNNVLGAILGLASAHILAQPQGTKLHQALETICRAAERGGKMVKSLLSFARQSPVENNRLDMNALLREQVALLERTTLAKVRLEIDLEANLRPILGDAGALTHAFMNLCVNAVDAMPENGTLTLRTRNVDNDWIEVVVEDNGMGMPKEVLEKAMEPFFTTKETGKGTGLGLSMVFSTVKSHRGQMAIESVPDKGTRVMLRFPAFEQDVQTRTAGSSGSGETPGHRGTLNVLLVDDDELIQSSVREILQVLGHAAVTIARSGEEALVLLEAGLAADLVILDMNMPGLGGIGTLPRLRMLRPDVPVLLATGRVDQTALNLASAHPGVTLLSKPFGLRELQRHLEN